MTRILSILAIAFYTLVSTGVHVDIDTCCQSIAGLSLFNEEGSQHQELIDNCCKMDQMPSCCPVDEERTKEGCPSDCVYIQVLQFAPQASVNAPLEVASIETPQRFISLQKTIDSESQSITEAYETPDIIPIASDLYCLFQSYITYG